MIQLAQYYCTFRKIKERRRVPNEAVKHTELAKSGLGMGSEGDSRQIRQGATCQPATIMMERLSAGLFRRRGTYSSRTHTH